MNSVTGLNAVFADIQHRFGRAALRQSEIETNYSMNIDTAFPSKYMKASDLPEEGQTSFVIEAVKIEEIGKDKQHKPVIYFEDQDKGFVANKTNCNTIAKILGSKDTEDWIGKTIKLYRTEVQFGDEMVESIRVSVKAGGKAGPVPAARNEPEDDEIPF